MERYLFIDERKNTMKYGFMIAGAAAVLFATALLVPEPYKWPVLIIEGVGVVAAHGLLFWLQSRQKRKA